jgi:hypothetical protein
MKTLILALLAAGTLYAQAVDSDSGIIESVTPREHPGHKHTELHFHMTSPAEPIDIVIWLYNDEHRLKAGDHVRLDRSPWGDDDGPGIRPHTQCPADPEVEPCVLMQIITITWLKEGEYE